MQPLVLVQPDDLVACRCRSVQSALVEHVLAGLRSFRLVRVDGRARVYFESMLLSLFKHCEGASTLNCDLLSSGRWWEPDNTHYSFGSDILIYSSLWHSIIMFLN